MLVARTTPYEEAEKRTDGITLFFTDLDWKTGALEAQEMHKMGRHAVPTYQFFMDDWEIPAADGCGEVGRGFYCLIDTLNPERIAVAAQAVEGREPSVFAHAAQAGEECRRIGFGCPGADDTAFWKCLANLAGEADFAE